MHDAHAFTVAAHAHGADEQWLSRVGDALPMALLVSDAHGRCRYANAAYRLLSGLKADQIVGSHWSDNVAPEDRAAMLVQWHSHSFSASDFVAESRLLHPGGELVWTRRSVAQLDRDTLIHTLQDIGDHKAAEHAWRTAEAGLTAEKDRIQVTLDSIGDAVVTTDARGFVTYVNEVAERMTGWSRDLAIGRPLSEVFNIIDAVSRKPAENPAMQSISQNRTVALAANCVLLRRDGTEVAIEDSAAPLRDRNGMPDGAVLVFHDARLSADTISRMAYLAQHDALTGLPNRVLLQERLAHALKLATRHGNKAAVMFVDLDNFKSFNDTLGHPAGDDVLVRVARLLTESVRETDTVCRYGGDEFVILLEEIRTSDDAGRVADKLRAALSEPLPLDGQLIQLSLSIGISVFPDHGGDADTLLRNADHAMYMAKRDAHAGYVLSDQGGAANSASRAPQRAVANRTPRERKAG